MYSNAMYCKHTTSVEYYYCRYILSLLTVVLFTCIRFYVKFCEGMLSTVFNCFKLLNTMCACHSLLICLCVWYMTGSYQNIFKGCLNTSLPRTVYLLKVVQYSSTSMDAVHERIVHSSDNYFYLTNGIHFHLKKRSRYGTQDKIIRQHKYKTWVSSKQTRQGMG